MSQLWGFGYELSHLIMNKSSRKKPSSRVIDAGRLNTRFARGKSAKSPPQKKKGKTKATHIFKPTVIKNREILWLEEWTVKDKKAARVGRRRAFSDFTSSAFDPNGRAVTGTFQTFQFIILLDCLWGLNRTKSFYSDSGRLSQNQKCESPFFAGFLLQSDPDVWLALSR